jgi:hypothetical protein
VQLIGEVKAASEAAMTSEELLARAEKVTVDAVVEAERLRRLADQRP